MKKLLVIIASLLALAGCTVEVPKNKLDYVGEWESLHINLSIEEDGSVNYKYQDENDSTSIQASIQSFEGDDFNVGFLFFSTKFEVTSPPFDLNGDTFMVVDGIELSKKS